MLKFFKKKEIFKRSPPSDDVVAIEIIEDKIFIGQLKGNIQKWQLHKFDYTILESVPNLDDENSRKNISRFCEAKKNFNQLKWFLIR